MQMHDDRRKQPGIDRAAGELAAHYTVVAAARELIHGNAVYLGRLEAMLGLPHRNGDVHAGDEREQSPTGAGDDEQ